MLSSGAPSEGGRRYPRRLAIMVIVGVLALTGMAPAPDTPSLSSNTEASQSAFEPRAGGYIGWTVMRGMITSGFFKGLVGKHTVVVVPMEVEGGKRLTTPRMRTRLLAEVRDFWSRSVPGLSFRFIVKKSVTVPRSYCTDAGAAWTLAARQTAGFDPYRKFNHLAAIVDCDNAWGLGDVRAGSGRVAAGAWASAILAHELGHNLGLRHSNSMYCKEGYWLKPKGCTQLEYADDFDIMGNSGMIERLTLHGLWRALLVGTQSLPKALPATVTLERPGARRAARPLVLRSSLGPLFIDHAAFDVEGETCSTPEVQVRVATRDGKDESPGQALIGVKAAGGEVTGTPGPLDPFAIPGTKYRAFISSYGDDTVALRVVPLSDMKAPAVPDYQDLPDSPVLLLLTEDQDSWEALRTLTVTLPRAQGVVGYVVRGVDTCSSAIPPGGSLQVTIDDRTVQEIEITPVGANGVTGKTERLQLTGEQLEMKFIDRYPEPGDIIRWEIPADQPSRVTGAVQQFTISYRPGFPEGCGNYDCRPDPVVIDTLPASARQWDPAGALRQYAESNGCLDITLTARSKDGPLWRDSIYPCRA